MALVSNGCKNNVNATLLPSGYTKPSVVTFSDYEYQTLNQTVTIAKSTVENASDVTTVTALVAAIVTALDTQIGADYDDTALTITYYSVLKSISTNFDLDGVLYTNGAANYECNVDIFVKTA